MKAHIRKHHEGGRLYNCPFCDYRFYRTHYIIVHIEFIMRSGSVQEFVSFSSGRLVREGNFHSGVLEGRKNIEDKGQDQFGTVSEVQGWCVLEISLS